MVCRHDDAWRSVHQAAIRETYPHQRAVRTSGSERTSRDFPESPDRPWAQGDASETMSKELGEETICSTVAPGATMRASEECPLHPNTNRAGDRWRDRARAHAPEQYQ